MGLLQEAGRLRETNRELRARVADLADQLEAVEQRAAEREAAAAAGERSRQLGQDWEVEEIARLEREVPCQPLQK